VAERTKQSNSRLMEAESAPASGGHITPSPETASNSTSETSAEDEIDERSGAGQAQERTRAAERTNVIPRAARADLEPDDSLATPHAVGGRRGRPAVRRVKRTLRHIDPVSVLKLSLFYYACLVLLWLAGVAVMYTVFSAAGGLETLESLGRAFVLWQDVDISLWLIERWAFLVGLTLAVLASLVNVLFAFLYNLAADVVGGAEMTFVDRDI
jgi:hypothetical protein